eukprot:2548037-Lingulodinium_polyedra.AAC.1
MLVTVTLMVMGFSSAQQLPRCGSPSHGRRGWAADGIGNAPRIAAHRPARRPCLPAQAHSWAEAGRS